MGHNLQNVYHPNSLTRINEAVRIAAKTAAEADLLATQNLLVVASGDAGALPEFDWPLAVTGPAGRPLTDAWAPVEYLQAKFFLPRLARD